VWTGREAVENGLVDHIGGLWKALDVAISLLPSSEQISFKTKYRVQMITKSLSFQHMFRHFFRSTVFSNLLHIPINYEGISRDMSHFLRQLFQTPKDLLYAVYS